MKNIFLTRRINTIIILLILISLLSILSIAGCTSPFLGKTASQSIEKIKFELDKSKVVLVVDEQENISFNTTISGQVKWSSDNQEICTVSEDGTVQAKSVGKARIKAEVGEKFFAFCDIVVCDAVISRDYTDKTIGFDKTRFDNVSKALALCDNVVIMSGQYDEYVITNGNKHLLGLGQVYLHGINGENLSLDNITFESESLQDKSIVEAKKSLQMDNCKVYFTGKDHQGVIGMLTGTECTSIIISNSIFSNLGCAVNCVLSPAEYNIQSNKLISCGVGISIDLRRTGEFGNVNASGIVKANIFGECEKNTEFLFAGGNYDGKLDFFDYQK